MIFVFAGPTISHEEITQHIDCICLPPISHGDILQILPKMPEAIGIIDGFFEGAPSVWHKEILYAMDQGVHVYGSSSMGALRAAELHLFGMVGIGQIYDWYRDDVLSDDDEVAVLHGPGEVGYLAASEPMVNIRATLASAHEQHVINKVQKNTLLATAKSTFYKKRSWSHLLKSSIELFGDESLTRNLETWLKQNRIDLKKNDAIQMLKTMHQNLSDHSIKRESSFHFEWTHVWDTALYERERAHVKAKPLSDGDQKVLDQLRLNPDQFDRYHDKALLSWICSNRVETSTIDAELKVALKKFRAKNQLATRPQLLAYMAQANWNESQLTLLLESVSRVNQTRQAAGELQSAIIDQLKLDGLYFELLEIANLKQKTIEAAGVDPEHPGVLPLQILAWYFEQQLGVSIPHRIEDHLNKIGLDGTKDFYRSITKEYLYWREQNF